MPGSTGVKLPNITYRDFADHLNHITSGKWAEKRCRICTLKEVDKYVPQFDVGPGQTTMIGVLEHEHRVPRGATILEPVCCDLCARGLYEVRKEKRVCPECIDTFGIGNQLWQCLQCNRVRKWGDGQPAEKSCKMLGCRACGDVTEHGFLEVSRGVR